MNRRIIIRQMGTSTVLLLISLLLTRGAGANTLIVPGQYATIGAALEVAKNADTIIVAPGTYPERLLVEYSVTLQGAGVGQTVLDGGGTGTVLTIEPGSSVTVKGVTITNGRAPASFGYGGGVFNNGILRLEHCLVTGNTAPTAGGGISNYDGQLTLVESTIRGNSADVGAGLDNEGLLTAVACTISGNTATLLGGGLANMDTASLVNCTVSGNTAAQGGGIYDVGDTLALISVTLSDNSATSGGGLSAFGTVSIAGTLVASNHGAAGADVDGILHSQGYNLIGDATDASGLIASDRAGTSAVRLDPALGPLQDNGGRTETMLPGPGSPVIDALPVEGFPVPVQDQRGVGRPLDGDADGTARADIGACEAAATPYTMSELSVCLRTAAGFQALTAVTARRLDAVRQATSSGRIDMSDAALICRKVAGTLPNP